MRLVVSKSFFRPSRRPLASSPNTIRPVQATIVTPSASSVSIFSVIPASRLESQKLPEKPTPWNHPLQVIAPGAACTTSNPISGHQSCTLHPLTDRTRRLFPAGSHQNAQRDQAHDRHGG